jgi:glycosyltransferase involved in cell wall biosynthesis
VTLPAISCQCLTFGRTACLEEALEFFLRQDYAGPKELVIVNDLPAQRLAFEHPEVRILNAASRYAKIGAKRNVAVRESSGEVIVCWDDDDGFLPGHLSACARYIDGYDYARPSRCLVWLDDTRIERVAGSFVAQHVFTREAFERAGGYSEMNSGQDMELDDRLRRLVRSNWPRIGVTEITYLFRWANGAYHLSGYGRDRPGAPSGYVEIGERVNRAIAEGSEPAGEVELVPGFRHDYITMAQRFIEEHARGEGDGLRARLEAPA